jgi:hypothetical protein
MQRGGATLKCFPYVCTNPNPTARQRHDNDESRNTPKNSGSARGLSSLRRLCNKNTLINSALTPDEPDLIAASAQFPPHADHTRREQINTNTLNVSAHTQNTCVKAELDFGLRLEAIFK